LFDYTLIGLFFAINLTIYLTISLPLDFVTYFRKNPKSKRDNTQRLETNPMMMITFFVSGYMWLIFFYVPIDALIGFSIFTYQPLSTSDILNTLIQSLGLVTVFFGTLIASWGRISRGRRAISWGIPHKLEKEGMYRYIRHPLYASYCFFFLGFLLILQNILIIPLLIGIFGYYELSKYEEAILIDHFGEEYTYYQEKVGRFFPRLGRRKGK